MSNFCQLWLTCANKDEANRITTQLLQEKLIACARHMPVSSDFLWRGKVDHNDEILVMMESTEDLFDRLEAIIADLHSYDTFVLTASPMLHISKAAKQWLEESIN